ncbi:MAG TPA: TonB-dependent receptor plug domain-containing protein, partial [Candidatus Polarisedimenticolaceae bacterium]|nr:TonB-dependent receptor plug domain-containing protein [Candidatus Polarisedimenticolaceae bacterium]
MVEARAEDASVAVIEGDDLAVTAAPRLDDALRQVAGFTLFRRTSSRVANPTTQGASLRAVGGTGAGRALVLDDGVPLADPFGGWIAWGRVPRLALDRVEVLRGGSALYGTSALAGVVQAVRRSDEEPLVAAEGSLGSEGTSDASLYAGGAAGPWSGSVSGESFTTDGYVLVAPEDRGPIDVAATSRQRVLEGTGGRRVGEGRLFFRASTFDEDRGNGTPAQTNETHLDQAALGWDGPAGGGEIRARAYGVRERYDQTFSSVAPGRASETLTRLQHVPSSAAGLTAQWSKPVSSRMDVLAGVEGSRVEGNSEETLLVGAGGTTVTGGTQVALAAFADGHARVSAKNVLGAGLRYDRWDNAGRDGDDRS